jgi:hypothetical protein
MTSEKKSIHGCMLLLLLVPFLYLGCSSPLGDGSLKGSLPGGWEESETLDPDTILRVIKHYVPIPYELTIKPAPEGAKAPKDKGWKFLEEKNIPGPKVMMGDDWTETERAVRIYRRRFEDGRILDAFVDVRFKQSRAESFLNGLSSTH